MDLESARVVKRELEGFFRSRYRNEPPRGRFWLGIAPGAVPTEYGIAVRAETEADLPDAARRSIEELSKGPVDVRFTGRITALASVPGATRGAAIGASVAHRMCDAGTLGFFARKISDQSIGLVSNNHVIAAEDIGAEGDDILHPATCDGGARTPVVIARLVGGYPALRQRNPGLDCAFARLVDGTAYDPQSVDGQKVSPEIVAAETLLEVSKVGRTTGLTRGRVSAFEVDAPVHYSFGRVRFRQQIEIQPAENAPFAGGGDSGSLVFTTTGYHPVGLLYAGSTRGGGSGYGLGYANPIDAVLRALGVTFLT